MSRAAIDRAPFTGWLKCVEGETPGPWRAVVHGLTWGSCWDRLLLRTEGMRVEKLVLPTGRHPDDRRRPR